MVRKRAKRTKKAPEPVDIDAVKEAVITGKFRFAYAGDLADGTAQISSRDSTCKLCREKIPKNTARFTAQTFSPMFNANTDVHYHVNCALILIAAEIGVMIRQADKLMLLSRPIYDVPELAPNLWERIREALSQSRRETADMETPT